MEHQATVVLIKPQREAHVSAQIFVALIKLHIQAGLQVAGFTWVNFDKTNASLFYQEHASQLWFPKLIDYMTSGSCLFLKLDGMNAVEKARIINGQTNPQHASRSTIRGQFKSMFDPSEPARNFVHASANESAARRELHLIDKILNT